MGWDGNAACPTVGIREQGASFPKKDPCSVGDGRHQRILGRVLTCSCLSFGKDHCDGLIKERWPTDASGDKGGSGGRAEKSGSREVRAV